MSSKKKAFVTGATGFLGLNLIEELSSAGFEVTALHRPTSDLRFLGRFGAKRVVGTITDEAALEGAMEDGVDVVFHVAANTNVWAASNATQTLDNVDGTRNMVNVALRKGVKRFVHTSSSSVFGLGDGPFNEDSPLLGRDSWVNYLRTKSLADDLVREAASRGLSAVVMRPGHIMGKYDRGNWATMIRLVAQGKLPAIPSGSGCFCNGREVAKAHVRAAERDGHFEVFVLGGPQATLVELVRIIGEITGKKVPKRATPAVVLRAAARVYAAISALTGKEPRVTPEGVAMATHNSRVDDEKARKELGYAHVPLHETVRQSYEFLRDESLLQAPPRFG
jgi:nucleoside-diphosphate-sugar epimerase